MSAQGEGSQRGSVWDGLEVACGFLLLPVYVAVIIHLCATGKTWEALGLIAVNQFRRVDKIFSRGGG